MRRVGLGRGAEAGRGMRGSFYSVLEFSFSFFVISEMDLVTCGILRPRWAQPREHGLSANLV